jgi:hypothetical protein
MQPFFKINSNVILTSFLWVAPNLLCLYVLHQQKIQIEIQQKLIEKMTDEISELRKIISNFEKNLTLLQNDAPIEAVKIDLMNNQVLHRFIIALLAISLSWHIFAILQAKWLGFSFYTLLPKISIPFFLPVTKPPSFFEILLGDYTIRVSLVNDKVTSILCKALTQMEYLPLDRYLIQDPNVAREVVSAISSFGGGVNNVLFDPSGVERAVRVFESVESVYNIL